MAREIFAKYYKKGLRPEDVKTVYSVLHRFLLGKGGTEVPFLDNVGGTKEEPMQQGFCEFPNGVVRLEVRYLMGNPPLVAQYALIGDKDFCEQDGGLADDIKKYLLEDEQNFDIKRDVISRPRMPCVK